MQRKECFWIVVLVVVAGLYIHFFTNWFDKGNIVITPSRRPSMGEAAVESVVFTLNREYKIKSLKVVQSDNAGKLDPHGHVLWHLVSDSNSIPTQAFAYGHRIRGMKQAPDNTHAEALQPDVVYWILVSADSLTGQVNFATRAVDPNG